MSESSIPVPRFAPVSGRRERLGLALIFVGIAWAYAYIGIPPQYALRFSKENSDYYNLLVDGFLAGHLSLNVDPPPALVALADPYDPVQRQQLGGVDMHDVAYYKGRYYLYFGVAPVVTLFLPFRGLTGVHFPQNLATVLFCAGGYFCSLGLLLGLRRRYFPDCPTRLVWLGAVMLGLGNFCLPLLARNSVWELPIASAYFYSCLGFWLLFLGWNSPSHRLAWWWGASGAFGLAVASRPHFVFLTAGLGALWLWHRRGRIRAGGRWHLRFIVPEALALFLPLALIIAGLLVYNYQRFGQPFEFGIRYQLGGYSVIHATLSSWRFFPINFYLEFLAPAQIQRYFPFFNVVRGYPGVQPLEWGGAEDPYGVLTNMPFSWLALLAPMLWAVWFRRQQELGGWLLVFGWSFGSVTLAVLCFAGACNRYLVDFTPSLLLVATLGLLMVGNLMGRVSRTGKFMLSAGMAAVVLYTAVFNVGVGFQHEGKFEAYRPETFAALSRWLNRPAIWWEALSPEHYGPVELTVRFPKDRLGQAEPLLVTGVSYLSDYVYIYYFPDGKHVQLGYTRTNASHAVSQPIPIDYNVTHHIGIRSGALYPPVWHPYFAGRTAAEVREAKETFCVMLDGVPYFMGQQAFYDTTPGFITFGKNNVSEYIPAKFTGEIIEVRRQPLSPSSVNFTGGSFLRLAIVLPKAPSGQRELMVATGEGEQSDRLFFVYQGESALRLGFQHAGQEPLLSQTISVKPDEIQLLDVSMGSFYPQPKNARERELAQMLVVKFNGQPVWSEPRAFHPPGPRPPRVGGQPGEGEAPVARFTGRIMAQQPVQLLPAMADAPFVFSSYWLETGLRPGYGAMRMQVELPRAPKNEPFLVTGSSAAQADYLLVNSPSPGQISFTYIHTDAAPAQSRRGQVDPAHPQVVEIDLPSLYPPESDIYFASRSMAEIASLTSGIAHLKLNGKSLFDGRVPFFQCAPEQITPGESRISETFGRRFSGRILTVERAVFSSPPGFDLNRGPLEFEFSLPARAGTGSEVMFATGEGGTADTLSINYSNPQEAYFVLKTGTGVTLKSTPVRIDPTTRHKLLMNWGGLYPDILRSEKISPDEWRTRQQSVALTLDGVQVLKGRAVFSLATPQRVSIGRGDGAAEAFSGRLHGIQRLP